MLYSLTDVGVNLIDHLNLNHVFLVRRRFSTFTRMARFFICLNLVLGFLDSHDIYSTRASISLIISLFVFSSIILQTSVSYFSFGIHLAYHPCFSILHLLSSASGLLCTAASVLPNPLCKSLAPNQSFCRFPPLATLRFPSAGHIAFHLLTRGDVLHTDAKTLSNHFRLIIRKCFLLVLERYGQTLN